MRLLPPLSFRQLLLLAFLFITGLLGAASLHGLRTLETLVAQSRDNLAQALQLNADMQLLAERRVAMERTARQYLVLEDPALRQRFNEAAHDAQRAFERLAGSLPLPRPATEWQRQIDAITVYLDSLHNDGLHHSLAHNRDAALGAAFRRIDALNVSAAEQVQISIQTRNKEMLKQLERGRLQQERQLLATLALAVLLALALGYWLSRPLRRLETAIEGLGENRLEESIDIPGPADLRSLGRRLDWLRRRLVDVEADKARFLRHISHELKTPLASLREGVALLEDGIAGPLNAHQQEVVRILRQHTHALQGQIEDLLRFNAAAFAARTLSPREVDVAALIRQVIEQQRLQWQRRDLTVVCQGDSLKVEVDADKFATVIANLLTNAIRFSPHGGTVLFTLQRLRKGIAITIADQGPGVAEEDRHRIFEPFYRGRHQPENASRGSGVGLSIVQEYVSAHGGRILLIPSAQGACFRIELP